MYSGSRRYQGVRYVTQYVPIDVSSGTSTNIQSDKSVTITSNGTTTIQPDSGYDAMSQVSVTTNVSGGSNSITIKSISSSKASEVPSGEIIPLSNFTYTSSTTLVQIPAGYSLIKIRQFNYAWQVSVRSVSSTAQSTNVAEGIYYYLYNSIGSVVFRDSNDAYILYINDDFDDTGFSSVWLSPDIFSFDFSS